MCNRNRGYMRTLADVQRDNLWPGGGFQGLPHDETNRAIALREVLLSLPVNDYNCLRRKADSFHYFIPDYDTLGMCMPFSYHDQEEPEEDIAPNVNVLYLSPRLDRLAYSTALAVIAHEIAHLVLDHEMSCTSEQYDIQEEEAWARASTWGYEEDIRKYRATIRRRETIEEADMELLRESMRRDSSV